MYVAETNTLSDLVSLQHEERPTVDRDNTPPCVQRCAYAEGGGARNGNGTLMLGMAGICGIVTLGTAMVGIGAMVTLGTTMAGIGGIVTLGTEGTAGIGGSVTCGRVGTVTTGTVGMVGTVTDGIGGTAGRPGTAAVVGAAGGVVLAKLRAPLHVLLERTAHAMIMAKKLAVEAMAS